MDIIINGPFTTNEFRDKVNVILQESRWDQITIDPHQMNFNSNYQDTYAECLAIQLHRLIEYAKYLLFSSSSSSGPGIEFRLDENIWIIHYTGNIGEQNYEEEVEQIIDQLREAARRKPEESTKKSQSNILEQQTKDQTIKPYEKKYDGFGVYLFPPYVIGKKHKPSISELLVGDSGFNWNEKAFDLRIKDCQIIVNKDGLIVVDFINKADAVRIFNVIMALGILDGFPLFTVREHDISSIDYNKENMTVTERQWHTQTIRANLHDFKDLKNFYLDYQLKEISVQQLQAIIQKAFKVNSNEKLAENLRLFTEAFTHLENSEYAQSFIMSWSVIERKYSNMWRVTLDKRDLDHDRYAKLINSAQWSFDYVIEVLNLNEDIDDQEYDLLMELKRKRNKIYHNGKITSQEDAKRCLNFIRNILKTEINFKE